MSDLGPPKICILALGSPHGDDRIAWEAAQHLAGDPLLAPWVHVLSSPWDAVNHLVDNHYTIVLDACRGAAEPGSVLRVAETQLGNGEWGRHSTHGGSLREAIELARKLDKNVGEIVVVAAEVEQVGPGSELSDCARRAVDEIVGNVSSLLSEWGVNH